MKKEQVVINISDLKEYWKNNKLHWKEQIEKLKQSIEKVWYITDIYVDENLEILAGHWRKMALLELSKKYWITRWALYSVRYWKSWKYI